jgi:hypothetical protein
MAHYPQAASRRGEKPAPAEMRAILHLAAEPIRPCDNVKSLIARAAQTLGLTYRHAKRIWYCEEDRRLRTEEVARLREERQRLLLAKEQRLERELAELRTLLHYAELRHAAALAGQRSAVAEGSVAAVPAVGAP